MVLNRRPLEEQFVSLACDPPWQVRPNANRQIELLEHLLEQGPQPLVGLSSRLGDWAPGVVRTLVGNGFVRVGPEPVENGAGECVLAECQTKLDPTPEQKAVIKDMEQELDQGGVRLLHGITGSGKTLVYLELAEKCLKRGKSVFLLAPEVALALNLYKAARTRLSDGEVHFWHGYQSQSRREATFTALAESESPCVVVGTRSALFLPLHRPGLAILDEEHDESFKQEERLSYQAKEIAFFRVARQGGLLLLGSATPDVKTFHGAEEGRFPISVLPRRIGEAGLPEVAISDISGLREGEVPFSEETAQALRDTVEAGNQAVILLNRRGYSPIMYCQTCQEKGVHEKGAVLSCSNCDVALTYHKGREKLLCHYCGLGLDHPAVCPGCGGTRFMPMGEGTERLEEHLSKLLPRDARILRLDRDSTRRQERMENILEEFARGRAQVMVGTQMLSKGHHFPDVTLVVAADADLGLNLPDYRASERTFQLLVQVAGRSGRGESPGRVVIQTRDPDNPFWDLVARGDYRSFYEGEIEKRRRYRYPPFVKLGLIRLSYPSGEESGPRALSLAAKLLREAAGGRGVSVLGPAPAPLSMLKGRKRFNCLLKGEEWLSLREVFGRTAKGLAACRNLRVSLDLDPLNML